MDRQKKETILFVDDEESILSVSSEYFRRKGYQAHTARTGPEALKILADKTIDCCFTDINMPHMNGLELAERIQLLTALRVDCKLETSAIVYPQHFRSARAPTQSALGLKQSLPVAFL